jgi:PHD/YefM family antitoxin component YafN of YafNO toxin-antitoxin module
MKPLDDVTKLRYNMTTKRGKETISMSGVISIRPSKDLRNNYAQISKLTRSNPVAITVNGKEDTVVLCHEDFMQQQSQIAEMEAKLSVYAHLAQAADDIRLGRVQDADEAFDELFGELDALEL